jgi:signal recognition particle receptor subunit beta
MSFINYNTKEIHTKVVWYGPAGSGKTASLLHVFEKTSPPGAKPVRAGGPGDDKTAYYDYVPLMLAEIRGFKTTMNLFTVPGADGYEGARLKLLEGIDGILFTADARPDRQLENMRSLGELREHLARLGFALAKIPCVIQCSFTDAPGALPPAAVAAPLLKSFPDPGSVPVIASVPPAGTGVFEALKAIAKLVLAELRKG